MIDYQEWTPADALRDVILAYWSVTGDGSSVPSPAILPDAHVELVFNYGDPVNLRITGGRRVQPARAVVGLLRRAVGLEYGERVRTFGVRFHPAHAARFFGAVAGNFVNRITSLGRLSKTLDERLAQIDAIDARSELEAILVEQFHHARAADPIVVRAVERLLTAEGPLPIVALARELAISPRHLSRRFVDVVGTPPKLFERLARFARAWRVATMGPPLTWAELALANGYADQAHLIREFRAFGAEPPAHLFTDEWYRTTSVTRTRT
jgi:AraC-like DNA-binding protein